LQGFLFTELIYAQNNSNSCLGVLDLTRLIATASPMKSPPFELSNLKDSFQFVNTDHTEFQKKEADHWSLE